jgi:preprotein translocase subunit SecA
VKTFISRLVDPNARDVRHHLKVAAAIGELEPELEPLSDEDLRRRAEDLRDRAAGGEELNDLLAESFALTREASRRTIGMRHFDVQLVGGIVLHQGKIAEMKTGEGKTLVASLPLVLNALLGRGAHLVTVNDYLARRDAGWMAPLYHVLGLTTGVVVGDPTQPDGSFVFDPEYLDETHPDSRLQHLRPAQRAEAYRCDITYGTNAQFGFDYLRDNMAKDLGQRVQRDLYFGIVDEVDSILIDEARTPHIISGPAQESTEKYVEYARYAARLEKDVDYIVEEKYKSASLTEEGIAKMQRMAGIRNIYDLEHVIEAHQINQALKARALFHRDTHYLVRNAEAIIIDEFTGRTMPGRRWSDGLHQAVEAKEGLKVQQETKTLATITLQNYFRLYEKLAGMTGTAITEAEEFHKIYGLDVVEIPTHRPMRRDDSSDVIYKSEQSKFNAVIDEIVEMHQKGRPVLVGTVSVDKSERLARLLEKRGIPHNVLNAKQHEREAAVVTEAGQEGAVTIATNMAGRGTDIVLGEGIADRGGLHIIGTERHESRRIDNQLRGRAGRQGDPGSSRFYISLEDDLMRIFGPAAERIGSLMDRLEVEPIEHKWVAGSIENAQKKVEGMNFDTRKHVVEYDDVMNKQRAIIYAGAHRVRRGGALRGPPPRELGHRGPAHVPARVLPARGGRDDRRRRRPQGPPGGRRAAGRGRGGHVRGEGEAGRRRRAVPAGRALGHAGDHRPEVAGLPDHDGALPRGRRAAGIRAARPARRVQEHRVRDVQGPDGVDPGRHRLAHVPPAVRARGPAAAVTCDGGRARAERPRSQRELGRRAGRARRRRGAGR